MVSGHRGSYALPQTSLRGKELRDEFLRLQEEYQALKEDNEEEEAKEGVLLNDAFLDRLQLAGMLQRYRDHPPSTEDLAERQRTALDALASEVLSLREENSLLAARGGQDFEVPIRHTTSTSSHTSRVRSAMEELHEEVGRLRRRHLEQRARTRFANVEEWQLTRCKTEARVVLREMQLQDKELQELQSRVADGRVGLHELQEQLVRLRTEAEAEQSLIRDLNREVVSTREACYVPSRLKRETSFLMKIFDQEGGRLQTRRHLRNLESVKKLYDEVAVHAASALPLAGRAKSEMEAHFTRYLQLEEAHNRALQRLHLGLTRGLLQHKDAES